MVNDGIMVLFENLIRDMEQSCTFLFVCCNILPGGIQSRSKYVRDKWSECEI